MSTGGQHEASDDGATISPWPAPPGRPPVPSRKSTGAIERNVKNKNPKISLSDISWGAFGWDLWFFIFLCYSQVIINDIILIPSKICCDESNTTTSEFVNTDEHWWIGKLTPIYTRQHPLNTLCAIIFYIHQCMRRWWKKPLWLWTLLHNVHISSADHYLTLIPYH